MKSTIQIRKKGNFTLPRQFRKRFHLKAGDKFSVIDLGDSSFLFIPEASLISHLGIEITTIIEKECISPDELLNSVNDEREQYFREHYS